MILGAGASWHYGYPTGEELVKSVIHYAKHVAELIKSGNFITSDNLMATRYYEGQTSPIYMPEPIKVFVQLIAKCQILADKLTQVNPPVIDYFLEKNPELQEVGQLMIAWVLLSCEAKNKVRDDQSDWYRFLLYQLSLDCNSPKDLPENQITFITFNYDISLERHLYKSLKSTEFFNSPDNYVDKFFDDTRFLHIYGQLNQDYKTDLTEKEKKALENLNFEHDFEFIAAFDLAYKASQGICTINNVNKTNNKETIKIAKQTLQYVNTVYILGYGFDQSNNELLNLKHTLGDQQKRVFFTNFEDNNIVNKRASQLFFNTPERFMPIENPIQGQWKVPPYYEKSTRSVYEALSKDFDLQTS